VLTGSSEGAGAKRKEREKGGKDNESEELLVNINGEGRKHGG